MGNKKAKKEEIIQELIKIIRLLRSDEGCPWDKKQTHQSLIKYLEQEAWEVQDAIQNGQLTNELKEELSDVLLQIFMHAEIAQEGEKFDFYDIAFFLKEKLIRRHPHVFDKENIKEGFDIEKEWDKIKETEQKRKYHPLERIPNSASLEYLFQKLTSFENNTTTCKEFSFTSLQQKLQSLLATSNKKEKTDLLGEFFCDLADWANYQQLSWANAFKIQLNKKKQNILREKNKK